MSRGGKYHPGRNLQQDIVEGARRAILRRPGLDLESAQCRLAFLIGWLQDHHPKAAAALDSMLLEAGPPKAT